MIVRFLPVVIETPGKKSRKWLLRLVNLWKGRHNFYVYGHISDIHNMQQAALENKLLQLATGHQLAASLYFVTVNKIPDCPKDGPRTAGDIATTVGLPARAVYRVLRAMTTSGIFRIQDGRFSLTEIGDLLRTDHVRSQRSKILLAASDLDVWSRLGEAVELEDAIPDVKKDWYLEWGKDEDPIMIFDKAMRSYYFDAPAPLLGIYDFSSINTLVDIAGGDDTTYPAGA